MAKKSKKIKCEEIVLRSPKEERLFQNLLRITQQFMQGKGYAGLAEPELIKRLSLPPQHLELFQEVLRVLVKQGVVEEVRGEYRWKKIASDTITGTIRVHARGFGFLQADNPTLFPEDVFIPKHMTMNAVDGDKVEVQVNTDVISEKGPEGRVLAILSRGRTHMGGIIRDIERSGDVIAHVPLLGANQRVVILKNDRHPLRVGDRIVMEVVEWGEKDTETICRMTSHIGHISDPTCDIPAAIAEFELRSDFSKAVQDEAQSFGKIVSRKDIQGREDLRDLESFTIDPNTAKDFDDALSLSKDANGHYHLAVHIADVSHYVRPGSALDNEAMLRCNSTYFPGRCVSMLPGELSNNLCSLKADVNRLTVTVLVQFDVSGNMLDYRIVRSVIKSAKRFTYQEAKEVLDGKRKSRHLGTLNLMVELCGLLKKKRYERGSIEFSLPELVVRVDEKGVPVGTEYVEYDITHQLVEEFMLKANELVAWHLSQKGKNLTYRIHDVPAEENMRDFSVLAGAFGFHLSDKPTPLEFQKLFDEAMATSYGPYLATSYIRRMRLASYSPDNIGHFGLGLTHYCHFTSPIRRYVDLVVHRILFGEDDNRIELEKISDNCSNQERISAKAENSVVLLKKLRLLNATYEKEPYKQYEAVVTRVKNFGLFFEVLDLMLEGFLHVSELENDYYVFEEAKMSLRGTRHHGAFSAGNRITVMLKNIDMILLESQWNLVPEEREDNEEGAERLEGRKGRNNRGTSDREGRGRIRERKEGKPVSSGSEEIGSSRKRSRPSETNKKPTERRPFPPRPRPISKKTSKGSSFKGAVKGGVKGKSTSKGKSNSR